MVNSLPTEKIKYLKEKGMEINKLDLVDIEFVYDVVINNKEPKKEVENKQYEKINWNGDEQLRIFLEMLSEFKTCKKIKQNRNSINIQVFSIFESNGGMIIHSKPQIILNKIKKRCNFYLTSDRWITDRKSLDSETTILKEPFVSVDPYKYQWIGHISYDPDLEGLKKVCSLILNDHIDLKKEVSNGFF